ncbi:MAG: CCA tRNA nucleotidyltransferase [Chrysiogenales bacterium]|nr:CCA tRNA nucleotidyltransferase [Candidatus Aminicenantes bacterium]TFG80055.1 MAG: CCA tRNA nucleotidyltransferase [Chrysiogenales bacterium]
MSEIKSTPAEPGEAIVLSRSGHTISRRNIDPDALKILFRLNRLGFTAYLTGGAVRDMLLGKEPKDFDIATNARPAQVKKYFSNAFIIGRRFRLAHIHFRGGKIIEVATFRRDPGPDTLELLSAGAAPQYAFGTPAQDAMRRDITVNALFYDPVSASLIDYVGGLADLSSGRIRVIGDAGERFREDPVRIWRVIRYAARLGFVIEDDIGREISAQRHLLSACSPARLFEEFSKDLLGPQARPVVSGLRDYGLLSLLLGRIGATFENDPILFKKVDSLLDIADLEKSLRHDPGLTEMAALLFWPWAESLLIGAPPDPHTVLKKALLNAEMAVALPKGLRAQVIDIVALIARMIRALRTGNMRWSMRGRTQFAMASRLCFLIEQNRAPEAGESFEILFRQAFPERPSFGSKRRRRPRKRKPPPQ